jgi:hypothetical protein
MGWTFRSKPEDVKAYLREQLTWHNEGKGSHTCLDLALTLTVAYAAVETLHPDGRREVWAAVTLIKYDKGPYGFGTKDMSEDMGPYESNCPERILRLLTPTDNEYAKKWRARCWENVEAKKRAREMKKEGAVLVPKEGDELEIHGYGKFARFIYKSFPRASGRRGHYLKAERKEGGWGGVLFKPSSHLINQLKPQESSE